MQGTILTAVNALSTCHPEQNPALAGQSVYKDKEIQDKQIVRLIGKGWASCAEAQAVTSLLLCQRLGGARLCAFQVKSGLT